MTMTSQFSDMTSLSNFLDVVLSLLLSIIIGSGVMTISFYKGLPRNPEIRNTLVWVLPNIWDCDKLGIPNLPRTFLTKCYRMLQNARLTVFIVSPPPLPPTQIKTRAYFYIKGTLAAIHLSGNIIILGNHLQWSGIFKGTLFLLNKNLQSSLFSKVLG